MVKYAIKNEQKVFPGHLGHLLKVKYSKIRHKDEHMQCSKNVKVADSIHINLI